MRGRGCGPLILKLMVSLIVLALGATAVTAADIGGYARCGADYVAIPASLGHPDAWGFAQRKKSQMRFGDNYSPEEINAPTASNAVFEETALRDGLFVVDCADVLLPTDGAWQYFEDSFMD